MNNFIQSIGHPKYTIVSVSCHTSACLTKNSCHFNETEKKKKEQKLTGYISDGECVLDYLGDNFDK